MENKIKQITCFKCGKKVNMEDAHYWYAFDQDNLICTDCAKDEEHTETGLAGLPVLGAN